MKLFVKLLKAFFWFIVNVLIKYGVIVFYSVKYFFKKPTMEMKGGLMPASHKQTELVKFTYQQLLANGKSKRNARKIIERKMRIKILPQ